VQSFLSHSLQTVWCGFCFCCYKQSVKMKSQPIVFLQTILTVLILGFLYCSFCNSSLFFILIQYLQKVCFKQFPPLVKTINSNNWHQELGSWNFLKFCFSNLFQWLTSYPLGREHLSIDHLYSVVWTINSRKSECRFFIESTNKCVRIDGYNKRGLNCLQKIFTNTLLRMKH